MIEHIDINTKPVLSGDAGYLEQWLLNQHIKSDIIHLWGKFSKEHPDWKDSRLNAAADIVFRQSQHVIW